MRFQNRLEMMLSQECEFGGLRGRYGILEDEELRFAHGRAVGTHAAI
jgi:hypothetical protein